MKNIMANACLTAALATFGCMPQPVHATGSLPVITITGTATQNGLPVPGAAVLAECGVPGWEAISDVQDDGTYAVGPLTHCAIGSVITVSAWINNGSIGVAKIITPAVSTTINANLVLVHPASVPEHTQLGGLLAATAGLAAIVYTRRRQSPILGARCNKS